MAKRFMKYDKSNPPAGCTADGVFTGGGNDYLEVHVNNGPTGARLDKTYAEIMAAITEHKPVYVYRTPDPGSRSYLYLFEYDSTAIKFWGFSNLSTNGAAVWVLTLLSDDTATFEIVNLTVATA